MSIVSAFIDTLDLSVGETHRGECPVCHGKNTFTVTNDTGNILYNCYKNSCLIAGKIQTELDIESIEKIISDEYASEVYSEQDLCPYVLPPYIVPYTEVYTPIDPMFLQRYGIDPHTVRYDVRQDRLVFLVYTKQGLLVDAVGRALTKRIQPKWIRYAASPVPYTNGDSSKYAVIVEDAISAYVVGEMFSDICTGVALLGTQLTDFHKWYIQEHYDDVIVALDPDALLKALDIAHELDGKVLDLKDDLKYKCVEDLDNLAEMLYA
jgi:hypothetical protein